MGTSSNRDPKGLAEEPSTMGEQSEDRISRTGVTDARSQKALKFTHERFGNDEIDILEPSLLKEKVKDVASETLLESAIESEDEAPETITASAGFNNARTAIVNAAKFAARQEADSKARRRERDRLLNSQAKASNKNRQPEPKPLPTKRLSKGAEVNTSTSHPQNHPQTQPRSTSKTSLPTYLPASILATSPPPLPSIQPPNRSTSTQKRKFLDPDPKPPKDLKRGNMTIRVLQEGKTLLPPKVSKNGRALREAWLMGRRQGGVVPRREAGMGKEFVRKQIQ